MKILLSVLLGFLWFCNINAQNFKEKHFPQVKSRTVIVGSINNYSDFYKDAPSTVTVFVNDAALGGFQNKYTCIVDDKGLFYLDFPLYYQQEVMFDYTYRFQMMLMPNDTLYMNMQLSKIKNRVVLLGGSFDAKHDTFQNKFMEAQAWLHKTMMPWYDKDNWFTEAEPYEAKRVLEEFRAKVDSMIELQISEKQYPEFIAKYLRTSSKYGFYCDLMRVSRKIEWAKRDSFLSFLQGVNPYDSTLFFSNKYLSFLYSYPHHKNEAKIIPSSLSSISAKQQLGFLYENDIITKEEKDDYYQKFKITETSPNAVDNKFSRRFYRVYGDYTLVMFALDQVNNIGKSPRRIYADIISAKDVLYRIQEDYNSVAPFLPQILDSIKFDYIQEMIVSKASQEYYNKQKKKLVNNISSSEKITVKNIHNIEELEDENFFNTLVSKYKNNVIYVDLWATWCGPCIKEMKNIRLLEEQFKGRPVVFLSFCGNRSREEQWREIIEENKLTGEHFFLNDEQWGSLRTRFNNKTIPRYIIIDKKGNIVEDKAPKPSAEKTKELLEKLLKE